MENTAYLSIIVGVVCIDINLINFYPHLTHIILTGSALAIALVSSILQGTLYARKYDEEDTEDSESESSKDVLFEGVTYEMNIIDLFDVIFDRLREKMFGKVTTVNADEIREVFMTAYNVTNSDTITMDAIEGIVDMVICCIEIIEAESSAASSAADAMEAPADAMEAPADAMEAPAEVTDVPAEVTEAPVPDAAAAKTST